jgi:hypothetical protein
VKLLVCCCKIKSQVSSIATIRESEGLLSGAEDSDNVGYNVGNQALGNLRALGRVTARQ